MQSAGLVRFCPLVKLLSLVACCRICMLLFRYACKCRSRDLGGWSLLRVLQRAPHRALSDTTNRHPDPARRTPKVHPNTEKLRFFLYERETRATCRQLHDLTYSLLPSPSPRPSLQPLNSLIDSKPQPTLSKWPTPRISR